MNKGFTLIESIITISILAILVGITVTHFGSANRSRALLLEKEKVISLILKARAQTLQAKDSSVYGVHFEAGKTVLFKGGVYSGGNASNETQILHDLVNISAINLSGGGSEVVFKRLSGATDQSGTIRLSLISNANASSTIAISSSGIAY